MANLLVLNPAPRKGSAQAKAMMAAVRSGKSPKKYLRVVKSGAKAPAKRGTAKRRATAVVKKAKRRYNRSGASKPLNQIMGMATQAAIGGAGAVANDVAFGYVKGFLPVSMQSPQDLSTGGLNPMYFLAKAGLAAAVGVFGSKMLGPKIGKHVATAAEGALVVTGYEILKSFVPLTVQMGGMGQFVRRPAQRAPQLPGNVTALPRTTRMNGMGQFVGSAAQRESVLR